MFLALRELRFARSRFLPVGAVVALIAALGAVLSGLAGGLADAGVSGLRALPATHLAFAGDAGAELFARSTVTEAACRAWAAQPGVRAAEPFGVQLTGVRDVRGAAAGRQLDVAVFGMRPGGFLAPRPASGSPLGAGGPDGVLVSAELVRQGLRIGDVLSAGPAGVPLRVTGSTGAASYGHVGVLYAPLALWQRLHYGLPGALPAAAREQATAVALRLAPGTDPRPADRRLGTRTVTRAGSDAGVPGYSAESGTMTLVRGFLYAISALVVGAFFTVWTIQRRPDIALLKAMGAGVGYLLRDALAQAAAVLLAATAVGSAGGIAVGRAVAGTVPFALSPPQLAAAAGLLVALGLLGAAVAVARITGVDPLHALEGER